MGFSPMAFFSGSRHLATGCLRQATMHFGASKPTKRRSRPSSVRGGETSSGRSRLACCARVARKHRFGGCKDSTSTARDLYNEFRFARTFCSTFCTALACISCLSIQRSHVGLVVARESLTAPSQEYHPSRHIRRTLPPPCG